MQVIIADTPAPLSKRQRVFFQYFTLVLIDLTVLNLFQEHWHHLTIDSFSISLLTAFLLQVMLKLTIYLEARGESFAGKMAVAAVIRNRMNHKYHSDGTVKGTVLRAKQFEPWIRRSPEEVLFDHRNRKMQESLL